MNTQDLCMGCMNIMANQDECPHCGWARGSEAESLLHLPLGTVLTGKYLVGKVLGQGGFGITYLAWDLNHNNKLAIKEFFPQGLVSRIPGRSNVTVYSSDMESQYAFGLEKFMKESNILSNFEGHPNIVSVVDFFRENGTAYMVMGYVDGITLEQFLDREGGKVSFSTALSILIPIMNALKEVHKSGFMHRDISPDNIFIDKNGLVTLIDFGAARQDMRERSHSLSIILKPGYAPEEQYRRRGKQGPWTDVYALAATFYRSIAGELPPESMDRIREDILVFPPFVEISISPKAKEALINGLAVFAENRFQNMQDFQEALQPLSPAEVGTTKAAPGLDIGLPEGPDVVPGGEADPREIPDDGGEEPPAGSEQEEPVSSEPDISERKDKDSSGYEKDNAADVEPDDPYHVPEVPDDDLPEQEISYPEDKEVIPAGKDMIVPKKKNKKLLLAGIVLTVAILLFGGSQLFGLLQNGDDGRMAAHSVYDTFIIDNATGGIPLSELNIGDRVIDPSWEWEHRSGDNYRGSGATKPVTWIVAAKDHFNVEGGEPHVTLFAAEIIGTFRFHDDGEDGSNHWGESGDGDPGQGLRPFLNETFRSSFSPTFRDAVLTTNLPNAEWDTGKRYTTADNVFILSQTELCGVSDNTREAGSILPYFTRDDGIEPGVKRIAELAGERKWYWTRSPFSFYPHYVRSVNTYGNMDEFLSIADAAAGGIRPALNIRSDTIVSKNS